MLENCYRCAKHLRLHSCSGEVKVCPGFIDNRAGCRRCINVRSCKKLGKPVGILYVCGNFQLEKNKDKLIPLEKFPDYQAYLAKRKELENQSKLKKRGRPKGSIKKFPKKSIEEQAQEMLAAYEKELGNSEALEEADKAALKNIDYKNQPSNWSAESLTDRIISANYDPRLFELVNEQDIPKATNPVQFMIDPKFLNISLFPMQLKISLEYFASFCPDCSDSNYIRNIKVDTPIDEILDRTVFYVNGVCPKCRKNRYEHIKEGKHHSYNTLVGIAGQRCVTGDTQISTENGLMTIRSIADLHETTIGFTKYKGPKLVIEDGSLVSPTFLYRSKPEQTYRVTLENGTSISGTAEHPIFTCNGFTKIKNLNINEAVPIYTGNTVHTYFINIDRYAKPSDCIEWTNTSFIKSIELDKVQETFDFYIPNYHRFIGNNILNHNSGKSIYHGIIAATILAQYLMLPNPVTFMKSVQQATFTMTFVGLRFQDAYDNLWRDFYANVTNSPWFSMYNEFLINEGIRLGKPLIKQADTFITYIGKRISISPSGPDKRKLRGRCITGNMLINTNKGLYRADSSTLKKFLVYDRGKFYNCKNKKQEIEKNCVSCHFTNGLVLEASEDHRIPCFDLDLYLAEAKDIYNKYVMCQLGGGFGNFVNNEVLQINKKDTLAYIQRYMISPFEFSSYSRKLQLAVLKFCACFIIKNRLQLSRYDANILASFLKKKPITYNKQDCGHYLIPGTNVYTKSELNERFHINVPSHLEKYIDKNIIFVKCNSIKEIGLRKVYDIEVNSQDHLYSANGILVHNTRILGSMDEISHFFGKDASMTLDADEVSIALENSLKTVRNSSEQLLPEHPDIPQAHAIYISSPRSKLDKGMRLLKQCTYVPSMYGFKKSTWEFNPNFTKASFKDEYARDPVAAETNFGANPPFGDKQYISNPAAIVNILSKKPNVFEIIKYNTTKDSLDAILRYPIIRMRPHGIPSILSVDAGYNNNSFALCLMHFLQRQDKEGNIRNIVACSGIIEIQPEEGIALSFPKIYDMVICKIIKEFNVKMVAFDRWQSIDLRQRIYEDFELDTLQYSLVMQDFENMRNDILSESFLLPKCEVDFKDIITLDKEVKILVRNKPITHLILQLLTSKDNGRIITKGEETSDDILRAMCLGHSILIDDDYTEMFDIEGVEDNSLQIGSLGAAINYSSANKGNTTMISGVGCSISY